jgi:hypothetical protein
MYTKSCLINGGKIQFVIFSLVVVTFMNTQVILILIKTDKNECSTVFLHCWYNVSCVYTSD